jgi:hypothetical protein
MHVVVFCPLYCAALVPLALDVPHIRKMCAVVHAVAVLTCRRILLESMHHESNCTVHCWSTISKKSLQYCTVLYCTYCMFHVLYCNIETILMSFTFSAAKNRFRMKQPQTSRALNHPSHFRRCPRRSPTQQPCTMKCTVLYCAVRNVL